MTATVMYVSAALRAFSLFNIQQPFPHQQMQAGVGDELQVSVFSEQKHYIASSAEEKTEFVSLADLSARFQAGFSGIGILISPLPGIPYYNPAAAADAVNGPDIENGAADGTVEIENSAFTEYV